MDPLYIASLQLTQSQRDNTECGNSKILFNQTKALYMNTGDLHSVAARRSNHHRTDKVFYCQAVRSAVQPHMNKIYVGISTLQL